MAKSALTSSSIESPNVTLVRRFTAAYNDRDVDGLLALSDPRIQCVTPRGPAAGHDALRDIATKELDSLDRRAEIDDIQETPNGAALFYTLVFRWRETGELAYEQQEAALFTIQEGLVTRFTICDTDAAKVAVAAGRSEVDRRAHREDSP